MSGYAHPWGGIYASIVCPMLPDGALDESALAQHASTVFDGTGLVGLLVNGHAGENATLSAAECCRVIEIVRVRCPTARIVAGVNREGSAEAATLARETAESGADAIMLFAPFSWALGVDRRAIMAHHLAVHDATALPLFLFQGVAGSGLDYELAALDDLLSLPKVAGIKEGSWNVAAYDAVRRRSLERRPDVAVMASGDEHLLPCFRLGSAGSLVSLAAVIPSEIVALDEAVRCGNVEQAERLNALIEPLASAIYGQPPASLATSRLKWCLHRLGRIPHPGCRAPVPRLNDREAAELDAALVAAGLRL